jgi:hypothetical protein
MSDQKTTVVTTPPFRLSYPNVFQPRKNEMNGKEEYSVVALFKKEEDLEPLKEAVKAAIIKKWGADKKNWPKGMRSPFRQQEERAKEGDNGELIMPPGYEEGAVFINAKSQQAPGVVDQKVQPIINESDIYAGCWARAQINAYAYDMKGNRGVAFGLNHLQKVKDDEPIGGRTTPDMAFAPVEGAGGDAETADDLFG